MWHGQRKCEIDTMVGNLEWKRSFIAIHATEGIIINLILKICVLGCRLNSSSGG
jgi:hypothetical protein